MPVQMILVRYKGSLGAVNAEGYNFTRGEAVEIPRDVAERLVESRPDAFALVKTKPPKK